MDLQAHTVCLASRTHADRALHVRRTCELRMNSTKAGLMFVIITWKGSAFGRFRLLSAARLAPTLLIT